jgi:UDP-GlcNAc:undecaprenyl-phosphate GlcNAc-1-phosphate transferase
MIPAVVLLGAAAIAALATPLVRSVAGRWGAVDEPGERKLQSRPIPLLGGWAIWFGFAIVSTLALFVGWLDDGRLLPMQVGIFLLATLILLIGGSLDDRWNLRPIVQIIFPIVAVMLMVIVAGVTVDVVSNPIGHGLWYLARTSLWLPVIAAFLWLLGMTYTTKLLDGLDGLATSIAAVAGIALFIASLSWDVPRSGTSLLALALVGACLGFLPFNWHRASIFLGEGGSTFLGFTLGVLAIISGAKIAIAVLVMGVPMLDVAWVIGRRILSGTNPFRHADRQHIHHRLLDVGLSQPRAVLLMMLVSVSFASVALLQRTTGKLIALGLLAAFMLAFGLVLNRVGRSRPPA